MKIIVVAMLVVAAPAFADRDGLRGEIGAGMTFGGFEIGSTGDVASGAEARLGVRFDRWFVLARGQLLGLKPLGAGKYDPEDGIVVRGGGDLRFSLARVVEPALVHQDFWIGAGLGYEHGTWEMTGGSFSRPDVDVALGLSLFEVWDHDHGALDFALELVAAHAPVSRFDPTLTRAVDHTVLFELTWDIGN